MHVQSAIWGLAAFTAVSTASSDWTIPVSVGPNGLLEYAPNNIIAPVGSKIRFIFNPKNHTVTQSSFKDPCHPLEGGFFSGFVPTAQSPSSTTFTVTVTDSKPIWFYCSQTTGNHCQAGMVGAINAPTTGNTLEAFIELAAQADTSTAPEGGAVGGVLSNNNATLSYSSAITSAAATSWAVSTYTTNGQVVTTTVATSTVFETILVAATPVPAPSSPSNDDTSSSTSTAGAPERTAHLLGMAAMGLGALVFL